MTEPDVAWAAAQLGLTLTDDEGDCLACRKKRMRAALIGATLGMLVGLGALLYVTANRD